MPYATDLEKARLIRLLDEARASTLAVLERVDPARCVHPETGWCVKDVVAHILAWEEESLRSLQALRDDQPYYTIPDFASFDEYNRRRYEDYTPLPLDRLLANLHTVREETIAILRVLPPARFTDTMPFPWPWEGTLSEMMEVMAAHERIHITEIECAGGQMGARSP